jgi:hypothetical protein
MNHNEYDINESEYFMHALNGLPLATARDINHALGAYGAAYDEHTRNLAELTNALPADASPWVKGTMRKCVKLYAKKHGLSTDTITAAAAAHAMWEKAFNDLQTKEQTP